MHEPCAKCLDLGVVRVVEVDGNIETLMRCSCAEGKNQRYALPIWEWKAGQMFRRGPCPIEWFKPEMEQRAKGIKFLEMISQKIEYWRAKVKIAEMFWVEHGNRNV